MNWSKCSVHILSPTFLDIPFFLMFFLSNLKQKGQNMRQKVMSKKVGGNGF